MRLVVITVSILLLSGFASAECREKSCMLNEYELNGHIFYFNEVFNIGTNWYIIFDYPDNNNASIQFNFVEGPSKVHIYDESKITDSISFSGSSFSEEKFNLVLNIKINGNDNTSSEFNISIDVNKPPADDMFYLWGGMSVFWVSIGAYVLYISTKLRQIRDK
tara:strand:- start:22 stop:510 length:489 start_codon:yes stop_codon:yes gene_type:complete